MNPLIEIRKRALSIETVFHEGGPVAEVPLKLAAAMAVVRNPYAGRYEQDLMPFMETATDIQMEAGIIRQRRQATDPGSMACLGQGVLNESAVRLRCFRDAQIGLTHQFHTQRCKQRLQLRQLAPVVRREDQLHAPSAAFCATISSLMPFSASASRTSISLRVKATPSAVPCTST